MSECETNKTKDFFGSIDFLFEMGMLARIERSGNAFLGGGKRSIADHSFRTAIIGMLLAQRSETPCDGYKVLCLCLFHDVAEARTGDLNYLQKKYVAVNRAEIRTDTEALSFMGPQITAWNAEFERGQTHEAILAKDADVLELLFYLKEQQDLGNPRAAEWFQNAARRLKTSLAIELCRELESTASDAWWKKRFAQVKS